MWGWFRARRRRRLRATPLPEAWREILERNFPLYRRLSSEDREELDGHVQVLVAEKHFEGAGGLVMTDEIRVTIAAQAALLLLHRRSDYYPRLTTILVYPGVYHAPVRESLGDGVVREGTEGRLGEAWSQGVVVVAWDRAHHGGADPEAGRNVVLHEFAHVLDQEDGVSDGAPLLPRRSMYLTWARTLGEEYDRLRRDSAFGRPTLLDAYGATNPAEFFAVATEFFFGRPGTLRRRHPELYRELREFYQQNPVVYEESGPPPAG